MDLQTTFYVIAIIIMVLWLVVLGLIAVILWNLYRGIKNVPQNIAETVKTLVASNKSGIVGMISVTLGSFLLSRFKNWFRK